MRRKLLPFWNERKAKVSMLVLHAVAFEPKEAIECFRKYEVSSHYLIAKDGEIWQLVGEKHRAWHAGVAKWREFKEDINSCSIGIELCSSDLGQTPFTSAQKKAATALLQKLVKKYKIKPENIVGHSDIAPTRKVDPGKAFFWQELANEGIGWWPRLEDADKIKEGKMEDLLQIIGYDTTDIQAAAYAFCRHFLPGKVKDETDVSKMEKTVYRADKKLLDDALFVATLRATAYKYLSASKTPCKI